MRVSNREVPRCWARGVAANSHTGNFWTDGEKLYSYNLCIGDTSKKLGKVLRDYTADRRDSGRISSTVKKALDIPSPVCYIIYTNKPNERGDAMTERIRVGDKVLYRAPRIVDRKRDTQPVYTIRRLYYGGTMAEVESPAGYVYKGYIVANMTKV